MDTVEANHELGFAEDERDYQFAAQILQYLGITHVRLLTNNPKKIEGLERYGIKVTERVVIAVRPTAHNERYLKTKRDKLGHLINIV